jgi:TPR repeat protein
MRGPWARVGWILGLWGALAGAEPLAGQAALDRGQFLAAAAAFRQQAEAGEPQAQMRLAELHAKGKGVPYDPSEALAWYCRALAQGHPPARARLVNLRRRRWPGLSDASPEAACERALYPAPDPAPKPVARDRRAVNVTVQVYRGGVGPAYWGYDGVYPLGWHHHGRHRIGDRRPHSRAKRRMRLGVEPLRGRGVFSGRPPAGYGFHDPARR